MRRTWVIAAVAVFALVAGRLWSRRPPATVPGFGLVLDPRGAPVPGARVTAVYHEFDAGADGRFLIGSEWGEDYWLTAYQPAIGFNRVLVGPNSSALATAARRRGFNRTAELLANALARQPEDPIRLEPRGTVRLHVLLEGQPAHAPTGSFLMKETTSGAQADHPWLTEVPAVAEGLVETKGLTAGVWEIEAEASGAGEFARLRTRLSGAGVEEFTFDLRRGHRFEGTVVDEHGAPLACAQVRPEGYRYDERREGDIRYQETFTDETVTGADGKFVLEMDPTEQIETVEVLHEGHAALEQQLDEGAAATVRLVSIPGYHGTVVDEQGHPVEHFTLNGAPFEHGRFELPGDPLQPRRVAVEIWAPGFRRLLDDVETRAREHEFVLVAGSMVEGTIRSADGGLADAWVRVTPYGAPWTRVTGGAFKLDLDPQDLHFPSKVEAWALGECGEADVDEREDPAKSMVTLTPSGDCGAPDFTPPDAGPCPWLRRRQER